METLLSTVNVGTCVLTLQTADNVNGLYTYNLLKTQYDACANGITQEGNNIVYNFDIVLPTDVGSCYYFKENDSVQEINVQIDVSNIVGDTNVTDIAEVSLQVVDYGLERCDPESNIIPHHKAVFAVNYTFAGDTMVMEDTASRYLDTPSNILTVINSTCTLHPSGDGQECIYYFLSSECRPMYVTESNTCVTDRFNDNVLNNMDIKVTTGGVQKLHNFTVINTALEDVEFGIEECSVPADINAVNVTDVYVPSLILRNRPSPDWGPLGSGDLFIKFYDDLILELSLNAGTLTASEVQIQSVTVTVIDPSDDSVLAVQPFTKSTKLALHNFDWTGYYTDAHFCTYHNNDNTCEAWYEPTSDRDNAWFQANLAADLADICQTGIDTAAKDYFSFHPDNWFTDFQIPEVTVNIQVVATVNLCDGSGRRLLRELQEGGDEITTIEYISLETAIPVSTIQLSITGAPTTTPAPTTPTAAPTAKPAEKETDIALILGATAGGIVFSALVVWWLIGGYRHQCTYDRV